MASPSVSCCQALLAPLGVYAMVSTMSLTGTRISLATLSPSLLLSQLILLVHVVSSAD